jgi:Uma2 family endonuclease
MITMRPMTAEQFARLPEDKSYRDELIRGKICVREPGPPGYTHGGVDARIGYVLFGFVNPRRLGKVMHNVGFVFERNPDTVCGPDVSFVAADRLNILGLRSYPDGAPDLAVEILSPSNTKKDTQEHVALYLRTGSRLVWIVDPKLRTITVHRPNEEPIVLGVDDDLTGGNVLPGFQCRVAYVFED